MNYNALRKLVRAYSALPNNPQNPVRQQIDSICKEWMERMDEHCWAEPFIGPTYAAGLCAGHNPLDSQSLVSFWRVCGLVRPKHMSINGAMRLLAEHGIHRNSPPPDSATLDRIANETGRNPEHLPRIPDYADLLRWLNRRTYSDYMHDLLFAIAHTISMTHEFYRAEVRRIRERLFACSDVEQRCERYLSSCNNVSDNELRAILKGRPTSAMVRSFTDHAIAKLFSEHHYDAVVNDIYPPFVTTTVGATTRPKVAPLGAGTVTGPRWTGDLGDGPIEHPVALTTTVDRQSVPLRPANEAKP